MTSLIPDPERPDAFLIGSHSEPVLGAHEGNGLLVNVHPPAACAGQACVVHAPSEHHMRSWPLHWRDDRALMERTCPHGLGHPDPDDLAYQLRVGRSAAAVHSCDGCCAPPQPADRSGPA